MNLSAARGASAERLRRHGLRGASLMTSLLLACGRPSPSAEVERVRHYPSGEVRSRIPLAGGVPHGRAILLHPSGRVRAERFYERGRAVGTWRRFSADGRLELVQGFADGLAQGPVVQWGAGGHLRVRAGYDAGRLSGPRTTFSTGGARSSTLDFVAGVPHGPFRLWFASGLPWLTRVYARGTVNGPAFEFEAARGLLLSAGTYLDGHLVGERYGFDPDSRLLRQRDRLPTFDHETETVLWDGSGQLQRARRALGFTGPSVEIVRDDRLGVYRVSTGPTP